MLTTFVWTGTLAGAVAGLAHAIHIYRSQSILPGSNPKGMALYRGLWAMVLWTLLGGYLLAMWIIGALLRPLLSLATRRGRAA